MTDPTPTPEANKPHGLQAALEDLRDAFVDLTTLEVYTYTGELTQTLVDGQKLDWNQFKPGGALTLGAATRISADYDTINYQASGLDNIGDLVKIHQAAVQNAQDGRLAIVNTFKGFFNITASK